MFTYCTTISVSRNRLALFVVREIILDLPRKVCDVVIKNHLSVLFVIFSDILRAAGDDERPASRELKRAGMRVVNGKMAPGPEIVEKVEIGNDAIH